MENTEDELDSVKVVSTNGHCKFGNQAMTLLQTTEFRFVFFSLLRSSSRYFEIEINNCKVFDRIYFHSLHCAIKRNLVGTSEMQKDYILPYS